MTKITIKQKMSGTGTIYDLASEHYDIEINMGESFQYAVCLPSYYNANATRHKTEDAALRAYKRLANAGYNGVTILDRNGNEMDIKVDYWGDKIVRA